MVGKENMFRFPTERTIASIISISACLARMNDLDSDALVSDPVSASMVVAGQTNLYRVCERF